MSEFDCPEVTQCGRQDVETQLLAKLLTERRKEAIKSDQMQMELNWGKIIFVCVFICSFLSSKEND